MIVQCEQGLRVQVYAQGGSTGCAICALITVLGLGFRECISLVTLSIYEIIWMSDRIGHLHEKDTMIVQLHVNASLSSMLS